MKPDDCTIYVFVRGDLKEEDQLIQGMHAVAKVIALRPAIRQNETIVRAWGEPKLADWKIVALDGGASESALRRTARKITEKGVTFVEYSDSDMPELGITALATPPLNSRESLPLANYRLRRYSPPVEASAAEDLNVQRGAMLP